MHKIKEITESLSAKQKKEIITLVSNNAERIGLYVVQKGSSFYEYISILEQIRTDLYLDRIESKGPDKTFLIIAEDTSENIIGYLLYNKDASCTDDVSICSVIVSEEYRKQGIFADMMNLLKTKSKSISLTCFTDLVNLYERFDFEIDEQFETQIGMLYGSPSGNGLFYGVDDDFVKNHPIANTVLLEIQRKLGHSFDQKLHKLNMDNSREIKRVEQYIKKHNRKQNG